MKNMNLVKGLALALVTGLIVLFLSQRNETATAQAVQTVGRYQIGAYQYSSFNPQNQLVGQVQYLFKIDTQNGDTWYYDNRSNRWVKVNN